MNPKNTIEEDVEVSFVPMAYIKDGYANEAKFDRRQWRDIKLGFTHFQNNDLGIAKITPCFENRKSVIFKNLYNNYGAGTTELHIFRPIVFPIIAEYALYISKTENFISNGIANFSGAVGQQRVGKDIIGDYLIALPPLEEICKILSSISKLFLIVDGIGNDKDQLYSYIQKTKSKILDLAIRGKLVPQNPNEEPASMLLERIKAEHPESKKKAKNAGDNSHYQNLPQGWTECTLESIGSWSSGATPNRSNKMYYENGTISWLKTGDLNDSYIDYIPEKITDLALKECSVRLNPKDSVLIAMYGATIGKIGILNIPATTNQACCTCITYSGIYNKFLFYLLMAKKKILQMKAEGGAQPNISKEKITSFPILLPPSQEQIRIIQVVESLFQRLDNITAEL
ncbi:type I restriction enzyme, S subunit [Chryseobacterium arachidis]|uniref:Type I restriction enzyme, S subunit n=1 Tax=Chryseobacterium arachidis TaxID=1416778 RepID=A0A1M4ZTD6_9FLAO|nr:restriction endonuclease subunit S [Chryseobacterium arachidis]SHF21313.1 type I restriction enzyme, S subunit [Chryseobacterium arachidis]